MKEWAREMKENTKQAFCFRQGTFDRSQSQHYTSIEFECINKKKTERIGNNFLHFFFLFFNSEKRTNPKDWWNWRNRRGGTWRLVGNMLYPAEVNMSNGVYSTRLCSGFYVLVLGYHVCLVLYLPCSPSLMPFIYEKWVKKDISKICPTHILSENFA